MPDGAQPGGAAIAADGAGAYEAVIGLEIHVQLATATKMFCGCELSFGEPPNTRTCAVCLGLPGSLPVANARAVHFGLMIGLALGSELAPRSIFHRKNYFYPDLPKGYQISQYDEPLCRGGRLGDVRIHRVHLEEDAAKLIHVGSSGRIHGSDASIVDFNRGGTPLAEIVTEPDLRSPEQASEWLKLLRTTLRQLGVSDVNMEEGSLRCDANISLRVSAQQRAGGEDGAEEHELLPLHRTRHQGRDRAPGGDPHGRRAGPPGDAPLRPGLRRDHLAAIQGGSARLPLLPGARTSCRWRSTNAMIQAARAAMSELPAGSSRAPPGDRAERRDRAAARVPRRAGRLLRGGARRRGRARAAGTGARQLGAGELAGRLADGRGPGGLARAGAVRWLRSSASCRPRRVSVGAGRQVLDRLVAQGGDPLAIVEAEGLAAMEGGDELASIVAAALAANAAAAERVREGNARRSGRSSGT